MKTINLYFDFEFTSLSPDAQPISLGIVSEHTMIIKTEYLETLDKTKSYHFKNDYPSEKSFYSEFTDFDINRCDNWVKENVVSKLKYYGTPQQDKMFLDSSVDEGIYWGSQNTDEIKGALHKWLEQFSDYQIQFVVDCGTWDWYWMVQLLAEWDKKKELVFNETEHYLQPEHLRHKEELELFVKAKGREIIRVVDMLPKVNMDIKPNIISASVQDNSAYYIITKTGLPKLPDNISPVPFDLNDLIAIRKGITPQEAFDLNREELTISKCLIIDKSKFQKDEINKIIEMYQADGTFDTELAKELKSDTYKQLEDEYKHNALWDAKVIKAIYNKLI